MADDVNDIEQEIRRNRMALSRDFRELEDRAHAAVDWRTQYQEHISFALGAAFGAGAILGALSSRSPRAESSRRTLLSALDPSGRVSHQIGDLWGDLLGTFIATAGAATFARLADVVPGFKEQVDARAPGRP